MSAEVISISNYKKKKQVNNQYGYTGTTFYYSNKYEEIKNKNIKDLELDEIIWRESQINPTFSKPLNEWTNKDIKMLKKVLLSKYGRKIEEYESVVKLINTYKARMKA